MSAALSSPAAGAWGRLLGLSALLALALPVAGCTVTPDPCQGYPLACVAVTVDSGPRDTYQLLVAVLDGYGSTTPLTPRQQPNQPLVYPLRFALRFGEFDPFHKGTISFTVEALNHSDDAIGYLHQQLSINGYEHKKTSVSFGSLPDMADPATPPDLAPPAAPDLATSSDFPDLLDLPEMP
ncbi:MAG TPA: hypothetical protein PLW65_22855 [Pseudomonadota bacterium]|nr:hypothetical protein [Pseudomonadota bacterium]